MTIKTFHRDGYGTGRGDNPHGWHPSMGEPKTAAGGSGAKPPKKTKTTTGGNGEDPYGGMGKKKSGTQHGKPETSHDFNKNGIPMHPQHVLPQKKVSRDMHSQSDQIMKTGNVYNVPDSYWGNR